MTQIYKNFIGGEWTNCRTGKTFPNVNPADTREIVGEFQDSDETDVRDAIAAARKAQAVWANTPAPKRGEILFRAANLLEQRGAEIAREMTREEGKILPEAVGETARAINILRFFAGEGARLAGAAIPSERDRVFIHTVKKPLGVVGLITPWNFPIAIPAWKLAPALIAGNAVVIKPSEHAPLCTLRLIEILDEAGVTKGALNLITGAGKAGAEIVSNSNVDAISFTGSEATGSAIAVEAAKRRARLQLEMGGKNPTIVLKDADLDEAVGIVSNAAYFSTGQKCTATSRVIVEEAVLPEFTERLRMKTANLRVGNGLENGIEIGPAINEPQLEKIVSAVLQAQKDGAKILAGGEHLTGGELARGYFYSPTLLTDVNPQMEIAQEEVFGPVLALLPARNIDEAVSLANNIRFGLSAAICTRSITSAFEFINRVQAGLIMVNLPSAGVEYQVPFGGTKSSSIGMREQGSVAVDFYTQMQTVYLKY